MVTSRPRAGMLGSVSPASPPAAIRMVARTATGWETSEEAAVELGATNGVQADVPRSTSVSDVHWVVTPDDSMKSRNGGLIRPSRTSAITHHATAIAEAKDHHAVNLHQRRFGRWQAHQMIAGRHAARLATALTAPISASATPARPASIRSGAAPVSDPGEPRNARITGSSTHGASIIGHVSEEMDPSVVSTRGDSAKATAPTSRDGRVPMPSVSATRIRPQHPTVSRIAHHDRWVTHAGTPRVWPTRKNAPCGNR